MQCIHIVHCIVWAAQQGCLSLLETKAARHRRCFRRRTIRGVHRCNRRHLHIFTVSGLKVGFTPGQGWNASVAGNVCRFCLLLYNHIVLQISSDIVAGCRTSTPVLLWALLGVGPWMTSLCEQHILHCCGLYLLSKGLTCNVTLLRLARLNDGVNLGYNSPLYNKFTVHNELMANGCWYLTRCGENTFLTNLRI